MGLDISVYKQLQKIDAIVENDEDGYAQVLDPVTRQPLENYFIPYIHPAFPGRADELIDGAVYRHAERFEMDRATYGGYGEWREELARFAGYPATADGSHAETAYESKGGPFWELINFSDCEGTLGAATCKKLAADFAAFQDEADEHEDDYFSSVYDSWREAVEVASDQGAIEFC